MTLDEPSKNDTIIEQDGVKIAVESDITSYNGNLEIDYRHSIFGNKFVVEEKYAKKSSCR